MKDIFVEEDMTELFAIDENALFRQFQDFARQQRGDEVFGDGLFVLSSVISGSSPSVNSTLIRPYMDRWVNAIPFSTST